MLLSNSSQVHLTTVLMLDTIMVEGEEIVRVAKSSGRICAVNYGYTG